MQLIFLTIEHVVAIVIAMACIFLLVLWQVPKIQIASLRNTKGIDAKDIFKAENDARATLAQTIATLVYAIAGP
jgi:hypothetical protein